MKALATLLLVLASMPRAGAPTSSATRFFQVDVVLDADGESLAAWQVEVVDRAGVARIVGVEGGATAAFAEPAYYDPRALQQGRIVLAAFQTRGELPTGRTVVARLHFEAPDALEPDLAIRPMAAADADGRELTVRAELAR